MNTSSVTKMMDPRPSGYSYEIFGKVQGVWFRKCSEKKATELGLVGWVQNTKAGSVEGEFAARADQTKEVAEMKAWLGKVGSPQSRIERAEFAPLSQKQAEQILRELDSFEDRRNSPTA
mmetsp:Transcript_12197/g.17018  ORF Transcript_12197/g.17018 Transcript_12197/m.17018 type:complete len:119 (-) Transcript_12197:150-506(-)